jgi:hypothetical protein
MSRRPFAVILALALAACGTRVDAPPPTPARQAAGPLPEPAVSVVHVPITLSLGSIIGKVETLVPRGQSNEEEWHRLGEFPVVGTLYLKEMWEREPLSLSLGADRIEVTTRVRYRARVAEHACAPLIGCRWVQLASCGHDDDGPMPSLRIGLRTTVAWKPDWTVQPHTTPFPVEAGVRCRLTKANVDVTERIQEMVQKALDGAAPRVDEEIREAVALRRRVDKVWTKIQKPIRAGKDVYLTLSPRAVAVAPPTANGTELSTVVSLSVRPKVVVGAPPQARPVPLPNYTTAAEGDTFRISLTAELPFTTADTLLRKALLGRHLTYGGHTVRVRGLRLFASGPRVVVAVKVSGDARGTVYLLGTPRFDPATREVSVPDLDFSVESSNVLAGAADWLLHGELRDQARAAARFGVGERIDEIRRDVNEAINRDLSDDVHLAASIGAIHPVGVIVTPRSLATVVVADGRAQIDIAVR